MQFKAKIVGLEDAMAAMQAAFPKNPAQQKRLLNSGMRRAARNTILPSAKRRALRPDSSGALSESLGIRTQRVGKTRAKGVAAGIEITPVRANLKAMAMYINFYYTMRGKIAPAKMITSGIRHGHLVEFGSKNNAAHPFLWPAAQSRKRSYVNRFAKDLKRTIALAVRRRARKRLKR